MGKPAARLGDMHICPMFDGPKPHVGGPITAPGTPTVLIGGMPAAVMGDICTCTGPPDTIALGSSGVFIGGKAAARMGDMTQHGGTIVLGCFTVLIGETGGAGGGGAGGGGGMSSQQAANLKNADSLKNAAQEGKEDAEKQNKEDYSAQYTLVDEADKPVSNNKYQVRTPDGQIHEGKTDASGKTEALSGFTTGECTVTYFNKGT